MWNKLHFGISEAEAAIKRQGYDWIGDWKVHDVAFNKRQDGTIVIASVPTGKGIDLLFGMKCEISLFPDGTYEVEITRSWLPASVEERRPTEGRLPKFRDGCNFHPSCFTCPEPDCIA